MFSPGDEVLLVRKLRAARALRVLDRANEAGEEVLYTTAESLLEQQDMHQPTQDAWGAELERKAR